MRCSEAARLVVLAAVTLLQAACQPSAPPASSPASSNSACRRPAGHMLDAHLLFGLAIPGGGTVSPADFDDFIAREITQRFPAGLTILPGYGQWRDPDGHVVAEGARMVEIVAPDTDRTDAGLQQIRAAYRTRFRQRAVGLITIQSCAAF